MGLVRLLTVGKALSEGKDWPGRYHMPRRNSLPSFGKKASSVTTGGAAVAASPELVQQELLPAVEVAAPTPAPSLVAEAQALLIPTATIPAVVPPSPPPAHHPKIAMLRGMCSRMRPMATACGQSLRGVFECALWLVRLPFQRTPVIMPKARQTYLPRLDSVRVVRNDLTDSDFEVVPKRPQPKGVNPFTASQPQMSLARKTEVAEPAEPVAASSD